MEVPGGGGGGAGIDKIINYGETSCMSLVFKCLLQRYN